MIVIMIMMLVVVVVLIMIVFLLGVKEGAGEKKAGKQAGDHERSGLAAPFSATGQ